MVFSMRCWKSSPASVLLAAGLALCLLFGAGAARASDGVGVDLTGPQVEQDEGDLYLSTRLSFDLPAAVEDALYKGIAVHFVADAEVMRARWYWSDRKIASAHRYMRLAYLPLTRRWRLNTSSEPIVSSGLGVALTQHYETLEDAMAVVQRISHWRIATAAELDAGARQSVRFRFRLDVSQLPRALQLGALGGSDWVLSVERRIDLPKDDPPKDDPPKDVEP